MSDERMRVAFAHAAGEYERGRPGYPKEAIDLLAAELRLDGRSTVVDLGAGTGKLARDLVGRFARVIAIEPLDAMRAQLERQVPAAEALNGQAEAMPLPDACADAVFVAQAFHWFDGSAALEEIARVLRPGGGLGLLWNSTPWESREGLWFGALDDRLERSRADLSTMRRHASGEWMRAFEGQTPFEPLAHAVYPNTRRISRDELLAALASRSYVAALSEPDQVHLLAEVERLLQRADAPIEDGRLVAPLRTEAFWTHLRT